MEHALRLIVADDHAIVREGLCRVLSTLPALDICAEAANGREALQLALSCRPDIVLMDIGMPDMNGIEATREIKSRAPQVRILILTAHDDRHLVRLALQAGADGYLLKNADKAMLAAAISQVMATGSYMPPDMVPEVEEHLPAPEDFETLTRREREIFAMVAAGRKNREISEDLHISVKTVEKHRANLMKKLDLHSVAELVSCALRTGFLIRDAAD